MRFTRPLRPAHNIRRRAVESATVALGAVVGVVILAGATAASASALEAASDAAPAASVPFVSADTLRAEPIQQLTAEAKTTLIAARTAVLAAETVAANIAASGLDVGVTDTTVDLTALRDHIERLSPVDKLPLLFLPSLTNDTAAETARVSALARDLRERLAAAVEKKAAEEAAAKAKAEAEAAAKAAAEAAAAANTPEGAKATARRLLGEYGWGSDQFSCLESLWTRESGWDYRAYNAGSGATGIPQSLPGNKMASAGADWQTNATTQIRWGLGYIRGSYGSPCAAWGHSQATGWY